MNAHGLVKRIAVLSIIAASAALQSGPAHSAESSSAPVAGEPVARLLDIVPTLRPSAVEDLGLPTKPIALVRVIPVPTVSGTTAAAPTPPVQPAPQPAPVASTPTKAGKAATTTRTTTKTSAAPAAPAAPAVAPAVTQSSVTPRQDLASAVAAATNAQRAAAGLAPLSYRSCSVPAAWAVKMASTGSLVHNSLMTILTSCGGTSTAGENIAAGYTSFSGVTAGWMASPTHRANILYAKFKIISVGVAQAANGTYYWVEDFVG